MVELSTPNYTPGVRAGLSRLITENKNDQVDKKAKPYIVTDWDNTAIIFDSQQNLFLYQLENLNYRLKPDRFAQVIALDLSEGQKEEVKELLYDIEKSYDQLYMDYKAMAGQRDLEEVKQTAEYQIFYLAMTCLYKYPFGYEVECCRILYLFENYSLKEVEGMTEASILWAEKLAPQKKVYEYRRNGKTWQATFYLGLRFIPDQKEFYQTCMENGIDVYVCSASHKNVVQMHANRYGIDPANILALEVKTNSQGKIIAQMNEEKPLTFKAGKAQAIRQDLVTKHDRHPLLVMGDSLGDLAMLTEFDCQRFLVHTKYLPELLRQMAGLGIDRSSILIQGRDDQAGTFIPSEAWESF